MKLKISNLKSILSIVPISLLIASCDSDANLAKVREFSENADRVAQNLPAITNDFYESCLRRAHYLPIKIDATGNKANLDSPPNNKQNLLDIKLLNKQLVTREFSSQNKQDLKKLEQKLSNLLADSEEETNPILNRFNATKKCGKSENLERSQEMNKGNSIIVLYMKTLGMLASEDLTNFDSEINRLSSNFSNLNGELSRLFSEASKSINVVNQQAASGTALASLIINRTFNNERIDTLEETVTIANEPLVNYARGLQDVVRRLYIETYLHNEEAELNEYYEYYIDEILNSHQQNSDSSVVNLSQALISMDREWNSAKLKIQERKDFATSYINSLQKVIDGHERLATIYNNGQQPSSIEVKQVLDTNSKAVKDFVNKAKALNKNER